MQRCNPNSRLAVRRLLLVLLQRSAVHGILLVCLGLVAPWAAVRFRSDSPELLGLALVCVLMLPLACVGNATLKDKLSGDLEFLKSLPVSGAVHGVARIVAIFLYVFTAVALTAPYLWPTYLQAGGEGLGGFVFAVWGAGTGMWVGISLLAAISLRFRAQRFFMWFMLAFLALGFGAGNFLDPLVDPYMTMDTLRALLAWLLSPVGAAVSVAAFAILSAALIALSLRWMATGVETYRREDNIMSF